MFIPSSFARRGEPSCSPWTDCGHRVHSEGEHDGSPLRASGGCRRDGGMPDVSTRAESRAVVESTGRGRGRAIRASRYSGHTVSIGATARFSRSKTPSARPYPDGLLCVKTRDRQVGAGSRRSGNRNNAMQPSSRLRPNAGTPQSPALRTKKGER